MILIVGGIASGKRTYVEQLGFDGGSVDEGVLGTAPVLVGLEELLREGPLSDDRFELLCAKEVVACIEVGSGVGPLDKGEREWRELVGRTVNRLSDRADRVVRMVCGIPVTLKGVHD